MCNQDNGWSVRLPLPGCVPGPAVGHISGIVVTSGVATLVASVRAVMDVEAVLRDAVRRVEAL